MKEKWLYFIGGFLSALLLVGVFEYFNNYDFEKSRNDESSEMSFEEKESTHVDFDREYDELGFKTGDIIKEKSFKVFQVLMDHQALVYGKNEYGSYLGTVYFLLGESGTTFYDDEIIEVPSNKTVRMNGTYRYTTSSGVYKTVPKIRIMDN